MFKGFNFLLILFLTANIHIIFETTMKKEKKTSTFARETASHQLRGQIVVVMPWSRYK
jgi:hypothetical protein